METTSKDTENVSKPFFGLFCGDAITFSHQLNYYSYSHKLQKEKGKKSR